MKSYLVVGASKGIGRSLSLDLNKQGHLVVAVARSRGLLLKAKTEAQFPQNFIPLAADISRKKSWDYIVKYLESTSIIPEVIIFTAAIFFNDLVDNIKTEDIRRIFDNNFFGPLEGISKLTRRLGSNTEFVLISTSSAFKGNAIEGIGYPASKAAISIAFESLHLKRLHKFTFKTIYLGPVISGMGLIKEKRWYVMKEEDAVKAIESDLNSENIHSYHPRILFLCIKVAKILPSGIYFRLLSKIEENHNKISYRK